MRGLRDVLGVVLVGLLAGGLLAGCGDGKPRSGPQQQPAQPPTVQPPAPQPQPPVAPATPEAPQTGEVDITVSAPATSVVGGEFDYALIVRNRSTVELKNLVVNDLLPSGVAYVSSQPEATRQGPLLSWEMASLGAYGTEYLRVKVRVTAPGTIENCATVRADGGLAHEGCATTSVTEGGAAPPTPTPPPVAPTPVTPPAATALTIVQTCDPTVLVCDPVKFRVRIENTSGAAANDVRVTSALPDGLVGQEGGRTVTLELGTVAARETRNVEYQVTAQRAGTYTGTAAVQQGGVPRATATCVVRVTRPVLTLRLDVPDSTPQGQDVAVGLALRNAGDGPAHDARIAVTLPTGLRLVEVDVAGRTVAGGAEWALGTLEPGREAKVSLRATADASGNLELSARAQAYCADDAASTARIGVTTGPPAGPELRLSATASSPTVSVGDAIEYVIELQNAGAAAANGVVVTCTLPAGAALLTAEGPGGVAHRVSGALVSFDGVAVQAGASPLVYRVRIQPGAAGNTALAVSAGASGAEPPVRRDVPVLVQPSAEKLQLTLTCAEMPLVCDPVTYRLVAVNSSAADLDDVRITVQFPTGLTGERGESTLTFRIGRLVPRQSSEIAFTARAAGKGPFETRATATAAGGVQAGATCTVTCTQPVLALTAAGPAAGAPGESLQFTLDVKNVGDAAATDCVLECPLPAGASFVSGSDAARQEGGSVLWALGALDIGATRSVTVLLRVEKAGPLEIAPRARGYCCEEVSTTAAATVNAPPPDLRVNAGFSKQKMRIDVVGTCTINVVNQGTADATNVVVVCVLPDEMDTVSATGPVGVAYRLEPRKVVYDPIAALRPGERATFTIDAKASSKGDVRIVAVVRADGIDGALREQTDDFTIIKK